MNRPFFALLLVLLAFSCKKSEVVIHPDGTTRLLRVKSGDGAVQNEFSYDAQGRVLTQKRLIPGQTVAEEMTHAYDAQGRLSRIEAIRPVQSCGACEGVPVRFTQTFTYDANGRLIESKEVSETGSVAGWWTYEYDTNGRLTRQNSVASAGRPGGHTVFGYDARGNVVKAEHFFHDGSLMGRNTYEYDKRPNPFLPLDRGVQAAQFRSPSNIVRDKFEFFGAFLMRSPDYDRTTRYTYDPASGYPVRAEFSDGTVSIFEYQ